MKKSFAIIECRCTLRSYTYAKVWFTIYVYNARWVGDKKSRKFVNVYSIKSVNVGRWVVKICEKL